MKAILVRDNQQLVWSDVADPTPKADEVLIKVHAAAINRADILQRFGDYPPPPGCPEWMGLEVAGEIVAVGSQAQNFRKIGDRVCALLGGGGYAEYVTVRYDMTMPLPTGIDMIEGSALPEAFATAYLNLFIEGEAKRGETLFMQAGASGLASVIIPMAKAYGLRVLTSVRNEQKAAAIQSLGADRIVILEKEKLSDVFKEEFDQGHGIDICIDCLGGPMMGETLPYMSRGGRWIMIATLAGDIVPIDLKWMYKKNLRIIGNTLRSRPPEMKAHILSKLVSDVWPMIESELVRPSIFKVFPIEQAQEAQQLLLDGKQVGKVVLKVQHPQ